MEPRERFLNARPEVEAGEKTVAKKCKGEKKYRKKSWLQRWCDSIDENADALKDAKLRACLTSGYKE